MKDDLPDVVHIAREAVYASLMSTQDGTAETMAYADAYARAAVLAERERCAKVCESKYVFADDVWLTGYAVGARDCADAIRKGTP